MVAPNCRLDSGWRAAIWDAQRPAPRLEVIRAMAESCRRGEGAIHTRQTVVGVVGTRRTCQGSARESAGNRRTAGVLAAGTTRSGRGAREAKRWAWIDRRPGAPMLRYSARPGATMTFAVPPEIRGVSRVQPRGVPATGTRSMSIPREWRIAAGTALGSSVALGWSSGGLSAPTITLSASSRLSSGCWAICSA